VFELLIRNVHVVECEFYAAKPMPFIVFLLQGIIEHARTHAPHAHTIHHAPHAYEHAHTRTPYTTHHTHTNTHTHAHTQHTHTHTRTHTHAHTRTRTHTHNTRTRPHTRTHKHTYAHTINYAQIRICFFDYWLFHVMLLPVSHISRIQYGFLYLLVCLL
jgi:hypothetical protein